MQLTERQVFTKDFYKRTLHGSLQSAREIIPLIMKLVKPKSVIDVGCGKGVWLSAFKEFGIADVLGIDGDWIDKDTLQIPNETFLVLDLKQPIQLVRHFDLVVSLEVAQYLPKECASRFVESLTKLGSVILFSSGIPYQTSYLNLNPQWPDYWADLFQRKGYGAIDCLRRIIWNNDKIEPWYVQNILLYVRLDNLKDHPLLYREYKNTNHSMLSIVHPKYYLGASDYMNLSVKKTIRVLPKMIYKAIKVRVKYIFMKE